jgi:hypothetical protein
MYDDLNHWTPRIVDSSQLTGYIVKKDTNLC